jgi:hypothetical protein
VSETVLDVESGEVVVVDQPPVMVADETSVVVVQDQVEYPAPLDDLPADVPVLLVQGPKGDPGEPGTADFEKALGDHVQAPEPHPAYDDMLDMTLIFENGLV